MLSLTLVIALAACNGGGDDPPGAEGAIARFDPGDGDVLDFGDVPFPSDLYLDEMDHPRIGALPTPRTDDPRYVALRDLLALRTGHCGSCNVYFAIDGELDPASVPPSAGPDQAASIEDAILLADVDPASPERGRLFPLRVEWQAGRSMIAVRPTRGAVLRRGRAYAAAITSDLLGVNGAPLGASEAFLSVRDGADTSRAQEIVGPAIDTLVELGVARERLVAVAAFTVGDPTRALAEARSVVHAAPVPVAVVDRVWSTASEIDALLGTPSEDRPGIDVPPAPGTEGTRAMRHATVGVVVSGRFQAPRILTGTGTEPGEPLRDASGALVAGELQDVPFVLIVPSAADPRQLPVVVHHHGFNASRVTGFVLADTAGAAGAAVLSVDGFLHGERAHAKDDVLHNMRGDLAGPDGFAETQMLAVSGRVFAVEGAPAGMELYPGYTLGAFMQFSADVMAAVRLVREGDVSAIASADRSLRSLAFDPARVFYVGNSMGAVVGAGVMSAESDVAAYALNVQPGSMVETLAEGVEFRRLSESVFLPLLGITGRFDEVSRSIVLDPIVDLFRWAMEPVDPLGLAPYLLADRAAPGAHPDVLMQIASLDEVAAPSATESTIAAAGIPGVGTFALAPVDAVSVPVSGNLETPSGAITAVAYQFDPAAHGMLEVLEQVSAVEPPLVPPFTERPEPIPVLNPIVEIHAQMETFLRSRIETGRAEVR